MKAKLRKMQENRYARTRNNKAVVLSCVETGLRKYVKQDNRCKFNNEALSIVFKLTTSNHCLKQGVTLVIGLSNACKLLTVFFWLEIF